MPGSLVTAALPLPGTVNLTEKFGWPKGGSSEGVRWTQANFDQQLQFFVQRKSRVNQRHWGVGSCKDTNTSGT